MIWTQISQQVWTQNNEKKLASEFRNCILELTIKLNWYSTRHAHSIWSADDNKIGQRQDSENIFF